LNKNSGERRIAANAPEIHDVKISWTGGTLGYNILLVEDQQLSRLSIAAVLERAEYRVHQAETGEQAVNLIDLIAFDTVISDYQLSGRLTGLDVLGAHHRILPTNSRILITAYGCQQVQLAVKRLGAVYLEKPFLVKDLISKIQAGRLNRQIHTVT
jgi:two-component system response regulator FlrC